MHAENLLEKVMNSNQELSTSPETPSFKQAKKDFPKSNRLLSPKSYSHVFAQAERFGNRNWTLIVRPNNEDYPRLGLAIAKKQLPRAVWRNRVKRIAREAFRSHKKALSGYDIVVLTKKGMQELDNETLHNSFLHLIRKIKKSNLKNRP